MKNDTVILKGKNNGKANFHIIYVTGQIIGFLEKYPNTRTETHPWKAFGKKMVDGRPQVDGDKFKAFYAEDGGKAAAVAQVKEWAK